MFAEAKAHAIRRVTASKIRKHPFPHVVVEKIFPPQFYAEIQRRLPPSECYTQFSESGRVFGYPAERKVLRPRDVDDISSMSVEDRSFWKELFATYCNQEFMSCWIKLFQSQISDRIRTGDVPEYVKQGRSEVGGNIFLMRDLTNFALTPHTDSPRKLVSILFYLPGDDDNLDLGTSLDTPKNSGIKHDGSWHLPREEFDLATTLPYSRNTLIAFPKTSSCFHGVEPVQGPNQRRDLIILDFKFTWDEAPHAQ